MKNLSNEELLKELPIVDIGQLSKRQIAFLSRKAKQGKIKKMKWYWHPSTIGGMKTWYLPL